MIYMLLLSCLVLIALAFVLHQLYLYNKTLRVLSVSLFESMNYKNRLDEVENASRSVISDLTASLRSLSARGNLPSKELLDAYERQNEKRKEVKEEKSKFNPERAHFPPLPGMFTHPVRKSNENVQ